MAAKKKSAKPKAAKLRKKKAASPKQLLLAAEKFAAKPGSKERAQELVADLAALTASKKIVHAVDAADALGKVGGTSAEAAVDALPTLLELFTTKRTGVERALARIGSAAPEAVLPPLIELLGDSDTELRSRAARTLGNVGPAAAPAIPELIE